MNVIYPGTFDPISLGHLNLVERAAEIYDFVTIAVSRNIAKKPMFTFEQRIEMTKLATKYMDNIEVVGFDGLLVDLMRSKGVYHSLRGIRGMLDFEYEFQMAQVNRSMLDGFEPIFLMPSANYMVLSSTMIREIAYYGGSIDEYIPDAIVDYINPLIVSIREKL